jgi:hypothetical protein
MPTLLVPKFAKSVTTMHTNPNSMLRSVFKCKKVFTNRAQQPKSNAQRVKQDVVATQRVKIVQLDRTKTYPATPRAVTAPVDLVTKPKVLRHAMVFLLVRTVGMAHFEHVILVIFAKVKPPIKPLAFLGPTPTKKDPLRALNVHQARMQHCLVPYLAKIATLIPTNPNPMLRNAFQCKKGSTNRVQQPKLNARRVKRAMVATQCVKIVK